VKAACLVAELQGREDELAEQCLMPPSFHVRVCTPVVTRGMMSMSSVSDFGTIADCLPSSMSFALPCQAAGHMVRRADMT
jgi:hypothetical protein